MDEYQADFEGVSYLQTPPPMPKDYSPPSQAGAGVARSLSAAARPPHMEEPPHTEMEGAAASMGALAAPVATRTSWGLMVLAPGALLILGAFLLGLGAGGRFPEVGLLVGFGTLALVAGLWLLSMFRRAVYFRGTARIRLQPLGLTRGGPGGVGV